MTPHECVRGLAGPIGKHGGAWMFDAEVHARGAELGLEVWSWYHCGRGGVLGQPDPSVVVAAFGFFPPALQTKAWNKGIAVMPAPEIADHYAAACAEWGRRTFSEVAEAGRLADLLTLALDAAEAAAGMPLFAGWRAKLHAGPTDAPARLALALQAARELRGSAHLIAVAASGLTPLEAMMSGRTGAMNAEFFGWPKPWPDPEDNKAEMAEAEAHTDRILEPVYAHLTEAERTELVTGLRSL
jgi:hypothetical protein